MFRKNRYAVLIIISLLALVSSCEDYYVPNIDEKESFLVVQGMLTDKEEYVEIMLFRTAPFGKSSYLGIERGAKVTIKSNGGKDYATEEFDGGVYRTIEKVKAQKNIGYYLEIKTIDGETYASENEFLEASPAIKTIELLENEKKDIVVEYDGTQRSEIERGLQFSIAPEPVEIENVGCLYLWEALSNYLVVAEYDTLIYGNQLAMTHYYYCWRHKASSTFVTYNLINSNTLNDPPMFDINFCPYKLFNPSPLDTSQYGTRILSAMVSSGYYRARQYTMQKDHIKFWENVYKQSEAKGKLFDPVDAQIVGNVRCTSDSLKLALGYFQVAGYSEKTVGFLIPNYKLDSIFVVDEFPETPINQTFVRDMKPYFWK